MHPSGEVNDRRRLELDHQTISFIKSAKIGRIRTHLDDIATLGPKKADYRSPNHSMGSSDENSVKAVQDFLPSEATRYRT